MTGDSLPLRFNQEQILLLWEMAARHGQPIPPFRFVVALRLTGEVDRAALESAINQVVTRHEGLRTAFHPSTDPTRDLQLQTFARIGLFMSGLYRQSVVEAQEVALSHDVVPGATDADIYRIVEPDALAPFDYTSPPFVRARLISAGATEHQLVLVVSHLVADLWAMNRLRDELIAAYRSNLEGGPPAAFLPAVQATDFACWEHEQVRLGAFDDAFKYWKELWTSFDSAHLRHSDLADRQVAADGDDDRLATEVVPIDLAPSQQLKALAARERVTPYVLFRCCVTIAFHRLTGRTRLALGGNCANRALEHTGRTIGWLNNRHLLVADFAGKPTGRQALAATRAGAIDTLKHQALPVTALWNKLGRRLDVGPDRMLATFDYHPRISDQPEAVNGTLVHPMRPLAGKWMWPDLDLRVVDTHDGVKIAANYATRRYTRDTVLAILGCVRDCAGAMLQSLDTPVARYPRPR